VSGVSIPAQHAVEGDLGKYFDFIKISYLCGFLFHEVVVPFTHCLLRFYFNNQPAQLKVATLTYLLGCGIHSQMNQPSEHLNI